MDTNCHAHDICIEKALNKAHDICIDKGIKLTKIRKRILELIWQDHAPIKAYDLLTQFQKDEPSAKPATIYRALDFLQENGLVHKIHRLNAFIGCIHPNHNRPYFFLLCHKCHHTSEFQDENSVNLLMTLSKNHQFEYKSAIIEIEGICNNCK